ncbi:LysR family transcriptional regulator [Archangium violaceum]|uniref:LysR family transcriptional regulator n=1 Tax=Archangium violaceum TaxID=83451 RepID=UPI00195159E0|nr:LysR family transcriptional regulator [Archangium violaceum]QRN93538.1 LysR family transcriptional regulator [Archangium violaceum]
MPERKKQSPVLLEGLMPLVVFVRAVDDKGFSAAARRLGLTPSAVSKQVAQLEERLGSRLLRRTTHHLSLTEAGSIFYEHCQRVLGELEDARLEMAALDERPKGTLRISVPTVLGEVHVGAAAAAFQDSFPEVQVELEASDRVVDLVEEGFDAAVRIAGTLKDSAMVVRRLAAEERVLCANPFYLQRAGRPRSPEDLARHDCLLFKPGRVVREWQFQGAEGTRSVKVQGRFVANNNLILRQAALQGRGIANLPRYLVLEELRSGALVSLLTDHPVTDRHIYLVYPHRRLTPPKVRAFADFIARYFQRILGQSDTRP